MGGRGFNNIFESGLMCFGAILSFYNGYYYNDDLRISHCVHVVTSGVFVTGRSTSLPDMACSPWYRCYSAKEPQCFQWMMLVSLAHASLYLFEISGI